MTTAQNPVSYVAPTDLLKPEPAPVSDRGAYGWARAHLFGSVGQVLLTLFGILVVLAVVPPMVRFFITDAVFIGTNREACLPETVGRPVGACWPFIAAKWNQILYGFYPADERWRVNVVYGLGVVLLIPLLIPRAPYKRTNALAFFGIYPLISFVLLTGGDLDMRSFVLGWIGLDFGVTASANGLRLTFWLQFLVVTLLAMASGMALAPVFGGERRAVALGILKAFAVVGIVMLAMDFDFGLPQVETRQWGGLLVTLVIAVTGIVASLPLGILLALGRRSELPLVKYSSIIFIEFWRGVPLITVLFFATYMLPLFLPGRFTIDGLLRALVGVALFASAYMAEVVRGGLQAIPKGQYEGAMAVGLRSGLMMRLVILPQALKLVIPGIVNNFIGLFKDTTLVLIVSIFDLLGILRASFTDPAWATPTTLFTGFGFAGLVYFVFCYGMSRYSMALERRLDRNQRH
ncbi:amino acid ABC transporter permease [Aquabacter spiritensis]|uniref:Amino acid ABC transporter membrane protein 2 (PAAT family) n=1 Tax=Aquabacter spiritensis TaxID=933073 RepID=A0A4R3LVZ8_9HYPH|nr:amino acid ABC transporter permease [Aquabacter spiritensis]TCT02657.1 amino acid ABC transporter membrane protein 2 (PAAT family) [Aquabacter spiritensis]